MMVTQHYTYINLTTPTFSIVRQRGHTNWLQPIRGLSCCILLGPPPLTVTAISPLNTNVEEHRTVLINVWIIEKTIKEKKKFTTYPVYQDIVRVALQYTPYNCMLSLLATITIINSVWFIFSLSLNFHFLFSFSLSWNIYVYIYIISPLL